MKEGEIRVFQTIRFLKHADGKVLLDFSLKCFYCTRTSDKVKENSESIVEMEGDFEY